MIEIKFDLLKKEDMAVLLEAFNTTFLQLPVKNFLRHFLRFIPNGFRPEKLKRSQLINVYISALMVKESNITEIIRDNIVENFENEGIQQYMEENISSGRSVDIHIIELTRILFEKDLRLPAYIVLLLYGIECSNEEKERSVHLYQGIQARVKEMKETEYEQGILKGGEKYESDLEAERKKTVKLQKSLDSANTRIKEYTSEISKLQLENKAVTDERIKNAERAQGLEEALNKAQLELDALKALEEQQRQSIKALNAKLNTAISEHRSMQKTVEALNSELKTKISVTSDDIKKICIDAIGQLSAEGQDNNGILVMAKKKFEEGEDVKTAWRELCRDSEAIMDDLVVCLSDRTFDFSCFEKFAQLEIILMLESAIEKALCTVGHKIISDPPRGAAGCCKFKVQ